MINRLITSSLQATRKSVLLLGPRQVGKSTLMAGIKPDWVINLADELEFLRYTSQPGTFKSDIIESGAQSILIDEIQRIPNLLNTIQVLIDQNKSLKFYLTGSSARKLKRGQANLLPGRVLHFFLGPLVAGELNYRMDTTAALETGCLPEIYLSTNQKEKQHLLMSYSASYLKEEIRAEALVRNLDSFARFLQDAALVAGEFIDFTKMANRSKISRHAIPRYFEILEDTLIGSRVFPWACDDADLDLVKHPKFYFFDNGVFNGLLGNFKASRDRIGKLAEQLVYSQLLHSAWAREKQIEISSFRLRSGMEVDFVVKLDGRLIAIEVKTNDDPVSSDLEGLRFFAERFKSSKPELLLLHMGKAERKFGAIQSVPWQTGLRKLGL